MKRLITLMLFLVLFASYSYAKVSDVEKLKTICEKIILPKVNQKYHKIIISKFDQNKEARCNLKIDIFTNIDEIMERMLADSWASERWERDFIENFIVLSFLSKYEGKDRYIEITSLYLSSQGISMDGLIVLKTARFYLYAKENNFNLDDMKVEGYIDFLDKIYEKYKHKKDALKYSEHYKDYLKIKDLIKK